MAMLCPECGGGDIVRIRPGWAMCQSSRIHSPRGPQDVHDGRVCGCTFQIPVTPEEEAQEQAAHDLNQAWDEWTVALERNLNAAADPLEAARLLHIAYEGQTQRHHQGRAIDIPQAACRAAWCRVATSGFLKPSHDVVYIEFERRFLRSTCVELSRTPAWACSPSNPGTVHHIDAEGVLWQIDRHPVPMPFGPILVPAGDAATTASPRYRVHPDAKEQDDCFPAYVGELVRQIISPVA